MVKSGAEGLCGSTKRENPAKYSLASVYVAQSSNDIDNLCLQQCEEHTPGFMKSSPVKVF